MKTLSLRRATAVLAAGLLATATAVMPALAAESGPATAVYDGTGAGYNNVYEGRSAGFRLLEVEGGDSVRVLCIEQGVDIDRTGVHTALARRDSGVSSVGRAAWIGINHASVGTPLEDPNLEAVAVQLAAWTFTDGLTYDSENVNNDAARARAAELVAAAGSVAEPTSTFDLGVTVERDGNAVVATATLTGTDGAPLSDQALTFTLSGSAEGELEATTDATGTASVSAPGVDGEGQVTVSYVGTLRAGTVFDSAAGQAVVTVDDAAITRTAAATFPAAPAPEIVTDPAPEPTPEPEPEPAAEPEPTPAAEPTPEPEVPSELPYTGPEDALLPLAVLAALALAGYGWWMRRQA